MRKPWIIGGCALGAAALIALGGVTLRANAYRHYDRVFPGVTCQGTSLAGMTYGEAEAAIDGLIANREFAVELVLPDASRTVLPAQTVAERTPGMALATAWDYGRTDGSFFGPWRAYRQAARQEYEVPLEYALDYSAADVEAQVEAIREAISRAPTDCTGEVDAENHAAVITLGEKGRTFDSGAAASQVCAALDAGETRTAVEYSEIPLEEAQLRTLLEALAQEGNTPVEEPSIEYDGEAELSLLHMGVPGYALNVDQAAALVLEASEAGEAAVSIPFSEELPGTYDLQTFHDWVQREPQETYYIWNGELVGGEPGYDFDLAAARAKQRTAAYGDTVEIPLIVTLPRITREYAEWGLFHYRLGSCDTGHTADSNRTTNLILACAAIDGTIINPGEEFSFNGIVGERTAAKGYRTGMVYTNSGTEPQLGGGICQVASTCYQAALQAGMTITERHAHMYSVTYCPGGLDATIYWGSLDFKFRNPWSMPIRVNASVSGGQVHVSIDGTNFTGYYIKLSSEYLGGLSYRAYRTVYAPDGSAYYREDLGVSRYSSH